MSQGLNSIRPQDTDKNPSDHVTPREGIEERPVMPIGEDEQGDQVHDLEGEAQEEPDADQAHDDGGEQEAQRQRVVRDPPSAERHCPHVSICVVLAGHRKESP